MKIIWTKEAAQDRADIWDYLHAVNPKAAIEMDARFSGAITRLAHHPESGLAGIIAGTRELIPHQSYRIVYEQWANSLWILAVVHTSRQWPPEH
jgi:addiction module RelE/StbE family toxin